MFWKKKDSSKDTKPAGNGGKTNRELLIEQAKANAKKATAEIGEDTLSAVRVGMMRQQQKALIDKALADIKGADADKVRDHIQFMIRHETPKAPKK